MSDRNVQTTMGPVNLGARVLVPRGIVSNMNPFCQSGGQKDEPTLILPPIAHVQQKRVQNAMHDPEVKGAEVLRRLVDGQEPAAGTKPSVQGF